MLATSSITLSTMIELIEIAGQRVGLVRSPRAKRLRLAQDRRGVGFRLAIPPRVAVRTAIAWAQTQGDWIEATARTIPAAVAITPGMTIDVAGVSVRLDWSADAPARPRRSGDTLTIGGDRRDFALAVLRWLKREARTTLTADTVHYAARAGVTVSSISIGDARSRWGSCSGSGSIRYNWRLILAPPHVREATVAHEVAHRVHMNHSAAFHSLVTTLLGRVPNAERRWLVAHGAELMRFGAQSAA